MFNACDFVGVDKLLQVSKDNNTCSTCGCGQDPPAGGIPVQSSACRKSWEPEVKDWPLGPLAPG